MRMGNLMAGSSILISSRLGNLDSGGRGTPSVSKLYDRRYDMSWSSTMRSNYEVEASEPTVAGFVYGEKQGLVENWIIGISRLVGKEELGGQDASAGALYLEVEMTCATRIQRWHDGVEPPTSLRVGKLMSAQTKASTVVFAVFISVPNLHNAPGQRLTAIVEDKPCNGYPFAARRTRLQIVTERCVRLEEGAGFPFKG